MQPNETSSQSRLTEDELAIVRMIASRTSRGETLLRIAITSRLGKTPRTSYDMVQRLAWLAGLSYRNKRPSRAQVRRAVDAVRNRGMTFRQAAEAFGLSRSAVHRYVIKQRRKSIDQAGAFKVQSGDTLYSRQKREWHCPEHGRLVAWPCVACAALAARHKRK